jgi:hypothetical protein
VAGTSKAIGQCLGVLASADQDGTDGAVMTANMKLLGWERSIGASSLRGLQGSATGQSGQAAKGKKKERRAGWMPRKQFWLPAQGEVFFA